MKNLRLTMILFSLFLINCGDKTEQLANQDTKQKTNTPIAHETMANMESIPMGQLSRDVEPLHYRIELTLLPDQPEFSGKADIELAMHSTLDTFYIHGRNLEVHKAGLTTEDGKLIAAQYEQVDESGVVRISLAQEIAGNATLHLEYTAPFNQSLSAAYTVKSQDNFYVFTQFEAISAREAFPGFDEPAFKVPFDISLIVRESETAIANTPEISTEVLDNGLKRVRFATTKPLPTYLIAFAVGDFDVVEAEDLPPTAVRERPVPLRAITVKGKGDEAKFALDNTRGIVEALETYFGIPYPYAKLDILAVPDFAAGAMENAGAITYRDSIMLVADDATPQIKRNYYRIHAHELAHQWFGDFVTPAWWDDIWLNEAFATWMAYVALDIWRPDDLYRRDLGGRAVEVMNADSKITARQIRQPILSNHDISNAFDGITYSKGGAVLSMFETLLGRDAFRSGVQAYMQKHAWGTATADDFINALAAQATLHPPEAVSAAFRSFLEQPGLPLVHAVLECGSDGNQVKLSQSRFLPLGSLGSKDAVWKIPVCLKTGITGGTTSKTCVLLQQAQQSFPLPAGQCPDYLMPNAGGAGYYRWSLEPRAWQQLLANNAALSVEEMMSLAESLDGAFNAGKIDIAAYMAIAERLAAYENWRIATAPLGQLEFIYDRIANPQQREQLQNRFTELYSSDLDRIGTETPNDIETAQFQRTLIDFLAIKALLSDLRETLISMAHAYTGFPDKPGLYPDEANANLLATALLIAVREDHADNRFTDHLQSLALASDNAVFRNRALNAMGHTLQTDKREEVLQLVFSPQLRDNEFYKIIWPQLHREETRESAWAWLKQNVDGVLERIPKNARGYLPGAGSVFCDSAHLADLEDFFTPRVQDLSGGPRTLASTMETIELCMEKAAFHKPGLTATLGD